MISKKTITDLYIKKGQSSLGIARKLRCSPGCVDYWIKKYGIEKRSISDAVYLIKNPKGDPFVVVKPNSISKSFLYGLGLGLYWGEGNKSNKTSVRIGNSDAFLIKNFIRFLKIMFKVNSNKLKFGLQVFNDVPPNLALLYWSRTLGVKRSRFQKIVVTPSRGLGSYKKKNKYGVLTLYYNNKKLRNIICTEIEKLRSV